MHSSSHRYFAIILLVLAATCSIAYGATVQVLSGLEIDNGTRSDGTTTEVKFLGWSSPGKGANWHSSRSSTGSYWLVSANFTGSPGITGVEHSASVNGGTWYILSSDNAVQAGQILNGIVTWPATLRSNIGCGPGIAAFTIQIVSTTQQQGVIQGCLDDTHLDKVFPPQIWATLTIY